MSISFLQKKRVGRLQNTTLNYWFSLIMGDLGERVGKGLKIIGGFAMKIVSRYGEPDTQLLILPAKGDRGQSKTGFKPLHKKLSFSTTT